MSADIKNYRLEDFPIVKCAEGEKILCVQRQHPIVLFNQLLLQFFLLLLILIPVLLASHSISQIFLFGLNNNTVISYIVFTTVAAFSAVGLYTFMSWFYQFYIITNRAIIHKCAFRITGPYSESVFGEKMHIQEIDRRPQNIIYDFLKIQDIYVYFHKLEREDPFVFRAPTDSQVIEELMQSLIVQSRRKEGAV